jgi:hypothetical protein
MRELVMGEHPAAAIRDPQRPGRLLRAEHGSLLPILRRTAEPAFDRPTACPAWSRRTARRARGLRVGGRNDRAASGVLLTALSRG